MSTKLHITLAQINPTVGDLAHNAARIRKSWDAAPERTDLIVFSELSLCGYTPEDLVLKPYFLDHVDQTIAQLVADSAQRAAAILVGAPLRQDGKIFNAVHLIDKGAIVATIRKHVLPNYGVFDDARIFSAAPLPQPVAFRGHKLGIMICEDMWSDTVARHLQRKGADMLISVNASPYETTKHETRLAAARERIAETGLPLIYVNQVGGQDDVVYDGASFALSQKGQVILQAQEFFEDTHNTSWSKTDSGQWLCTDDIMIPSHDMLAASYLALMVGLRDYVTKNGFPGVLLGLSGGIDSALAAVLAVDALGPDAVHGVLMPSRYTGADSVSDARALGKKLGIHLDTISIESTVDAFEATLKSHFTSHTPGIVHENIQPRCRGLILMALSNAGGKMVLSTGNKSEIAVGYATLYGDMCGGYAPLKDVYKTHVYALARWRNAHKPFHGLGPQGPVIPENTITRAPTAELKPNQTDQDTLPAYDILDAILQGLIEDDLSPADITARGQDPAVVARVWHMLERAEYKRRQGPPGPKISAKALTRDRRYPLTNGFTGTS